MKKPSEGTFKKAVKKVDEAQKRGLPSGKATPTKKLGEGKPYGDK